MGIDHLYPFIHETVGESARKKVNFEDFENCCMVFEGNLLTYRFSYGGQADSAVNQWILLIKECWSRNILPIVVFDGKAPEEKSQEKKKREHETKKKKQSIQKHEIDREQRILELSQIQNKIEDSKEELMDSQTKTQLQERFETLQEEIRILDDQKKDLNKLLIHVGSNEIKEIIDLLKSLNVIVWISSSEGEGLCALLNRIDVAQYVVGDDSDLFPCGAVKILRNLGWNGKRSENLYLYDCTHILQSLSISLRGFIECCCLAGNDFNRETRVKGFSLKKAIEVLKKDDKSFYTIETFREKKRNNPSPKKLTAKLIHSDYDPKPVREQFLKWAEATSIPSECILPEFNGKPDWKVFHDRYHMVVSTSNLFELETLIQLMSEEFWTTQKKYMEDKFEAFNSSFVQLLDD